jgi:hypothetical protein
VIRDWYVYDICVSKEDFQRFAEDKLGPSTQPIAGGQMGGEPQYFEIHGLVRRNSEIAVLQIRELKPGRHALSPAARHTEGLGRN